MEEKSKRSIDCLPPAACVLIEQLFGALDALLATEQTHRRNITHLLREFEVSEESIQACRGEQGKKKRTKGKQDNGNYHNL